MDIFKLGDKILALLEAVFGFWNNQISLVFAMLGQSPVSFKGGGPWAVIEGIEPVFVAVGSSLVVLFFVIGFCSESIDVKDEMRFESILRMLINKATQRRVQISSTTDFHHMPALCVLQKSYYSLSLYFIYDMQFVIYVSD